MTPTNTQGSEQEDLRMDAYYYSFEPTGVLAIDRILSAVATAGKRAHNTEDWGDEEIKPIQDAAIKAVALIKSDKEAAVQIALSKLRNSPKLQQTPKQYMTPKRREIYEAGAYDCSKVWLDQAAQLSKERQS